MFKVGDRVEITSVDSLDGELGEVVEVHKEGFLSDIRVHLDGDKEMGYSPSGSVLASFGRWSRHEYLQGREPCGGCKQGNHVFS